MFQELEFKQQAEKLVSEAWSLINSPEWKKDKQSEVGDMVETLKYRNKRKTFKLTVSNYFSLKIFSFV